MSDDLDQKDFAAWGDKAESHNQDAMLTTYVDIVNQGNSVSITILVGGIMISGLLVSADEWHDEMMDTWTKVAGGKSSNSDTDSEPQEDHFTDPDRPPQYLHLKTPKFIHPANVNFTWGPEAHPYMRFKISSVDGWILGSPD